MPIGIFLTNMKNMMTDLHSSIFVLGKIDVAPLKCNWPVNQVKVKVGQSEVRQTLFAGGFHVVGVMLDVPQFAGHKQVFSKKEISFKITFFYKIYVLIN